jgi:precorrin-3B synthase
MASLALALESSSSHTSTLIDAFDLSDGVHALAVALPFGSIAVEKLIALADAAVSLGATEIRFAPQRTLLVLGLSEPACTELRAGAASLGFVTATADPRTKIAACSGAPACASGRIATRRIAEEIAGEAGDILDSSFTVHISGCAKGCAHPAAASLTLVGGEKGAGLVVSGTARDIPAAYRPGDEAARGVRRVAALIRSQRRPGEDAAACLSRLGKARVAAVFQERGKASTGRAVNRSRELGQDGGSTSRRPVRG